MENKPNKNQVVTPESSPSLEAKVSAEMQTPRSELLQSLSAMMDNEAESLEIRRVVASLKTTPQLQDHWRRYHVVRNIVQASGSSTASTNLLPAIQAKIAEETAVQGSLKSRSRFIKSAVGLLGQGLVAASVAVGILVTYPMVADSGKSGSAGKSAGMLAQQDKSTANPVAGALPQMSGDYNPSALTRTVSLDDAARKRLEKAVRNFSGTSAVLQSNRMPMFVNQLEPFAPASQALDSSKLKP